MFAHSLFQCCDVRWCEAYGGVYADIDVEATKCFDPLLRAAHNARMAVLLGEVRNGHGSTIGCLQKRVAETTDKTDRTIQTASCTISA